MPVTSVRSVIKEDIGPFVELLAKLFKAFYHHCGVNTSFNHIRDQSIMTRKKA